MKCNFSLLENHSPTNQRNGFKRRSQATGHTHRVSLIGNDSCANHLHSSVRITNIYLGYAFFYTYIYFFEHSIVYWTGRVAQLLQMWQVVGVVRFFIDDIDLPDRATWYSPHAWRALKYTHIYIYICFVDACQIALQNRNVRPLSEVIKMNCNHYRCLDELSIRPNASNPHLPLLHAT